MVQYFGESLRPAMYAGVGNYSVPVVALSPDTIEALGGIAQNPGSGDGGSSGPAPATAMVAVAPKAVAMAGDGVAPTSLIGVNAARARIQFRNAGISPVVLGPAGVTLANAAIYLRPGDMYTETDLPGVEWFALAEGGVSTVAMLALVR